MISLNINLTWSAFFPIYWPFILDIWTVSHFHNVLVLPKEQFGSILLWWILISHTSCSMLYIQCTMHGICHYPCFLSWESDVTVYASTDSIIYRKCSCRFLMPCLAMFYQNEKNSLLHKLCSIKLIKYYVLICLRGTRSFNNKLFQSINKNICYIFESVTT